MRFKEYYEEIVTYGAVSLGEELIQDDDDVADWNWDMRIESLGEPFMLEWLNVSSNIDDYLRQHILPFIKAHEVEEYQTVASMEKDNEFWEYHHDILTGKCMYGWRLTGFRMTRVSELELSFTHHQYSGYNEIVTIVDPPKAALKITGPFNRISRYKPVPIYTIKFNRESHTEITEDFGDHAAVLIFPENNSIPETQTGIGRVFVRETVGF